MKSETEASLTQTQAIISVANHMVVACGVAGETILTECELIEKFEKFDAWNSDVRDALSTTAVSSAVTMLAKIAIFYTGALSEPPDHTDSDALTIAKAIVAEVISFLVSIEETYGSVLDRDKASQIAERLIQIAEESMGALQAWLGSPQQPRDKAYLN